MKKIIFILLMAFSSNIYAYDGKPMDQVDAFFKELPLNSNKAIDELYVTNKAMQQNTQALTLMKSQVSQVPLLYGRYIGYELVSREEISTSVTRILIVEKRELHPLIWEFYFYKPKNKWIVSQILFVDQFQILGAKK